MQEQTHYPLIVYPCMEMNSGVWFVYDVTSYSITDVEVLSEGPCIKARTKLLMGKSFRRRHHTVTTAAGKAVKVEGDAKPNMKPAVKAEALDDFKPDHDMLDFEGADAFGMYSCCMQCNAFGPWHAHSPLWAIDVGHIQKPFMDEAAHFATGDGGAQRSAREEIPATGANVNLRALAKARERHSSNSHRNIPVTFHVAHDAINAPGEAAGDMDEDLGMLDTDGIANGQQWHSTQQS